MKYLAFILCCASCTFSDPSERLAYSFYVAGHTYGSAGVNNDGLHPPFINYFDTIRNWKNMSFGVLTGDIVLEGSVEDWQEVDRDLRDLDVPTKVSLGNHEYRNPEIVKTRFQPSYYSFRKAGDLHIVLDPNLDQWNISGAQLEFFKSTLEHSADVRNIFVYTHQILWWSPDNAYADIRLNSSDGRADSINFWSEIVPLAESSAKPVYWFAGDLGAGTWTDSYTEHQYKNIHLIASGMGNDADSNFLVVEVSKDGVVRVNRILIKI